METLNIHSRSKDERAKALSNFSGHPFCLDYMNFASVEGFIQGIKFPDGDDNRAWAFASVGMKAKRFGTKAPKYGLIWWASQEIVFASAEHHKLIERAIRAKFAQNLEAMRMLLLTEGLVLTHETGEPDSHSLPKALFCKILTDIREKEIQNRVIS